MMTAPAMPHLIDAVAADSRPRAGGCRSVRDHLVPCRRSRRNAGAPGGRRRSRALLLRDLPHEIPVTVIGAASNLIVRDGGVHGVVIRLARGFNGIAVEADGVVAGAAALDVTVAEHAAAAGLAGLEFLSGIPGTIGGAVAMNAGAYGGDVAHCLDWAEIVTRSGEAMRLTCAELAFAYRHATLPPGCVVVRARFRAQHGDAAIIAGAHGARSARRAKPPSRCAPAPADRPSAIRPT